jgi:hypothetical protein
MGSRVSACLERLVVGKLRSSGLGNPFKVHETCRSLSFPILWVGDRCLAAECKVGLVLVPVRRHHFQHICSRADTTVLCDRHRPFGRKILDKQKKILVLSLDT